jgi:hypothetical protein
MNDLSIPFSDDPERDKQIFDLVVEGRTEAEVCRMLGVTVADVHRALDWAGQVMLSAQNRVRIIAVDAARCERMIQDFLPASHSRDDKAANVILKAQERKATLLGLNAPLRVDPIALAQEAGPHETSTENLRRIFDEVSGISKRERLLEDKETHNEPMTLEEIDELEVFRREREACDDAERERNRREREERLAARRANGG